MIKCVTLLLCCSLFIPICVFCAPLDEPVDEQKYEGSNTTTVTMDDDDDVELTDEQKSDYENIQLIESSPIEKKYMWPRNLATGKIIVAILIRRRDYPQAALDNFRQGLADIENKTCVRFVNRTEQENYIFVSDNGEEKCSSKLGRIGGKQHLHLTPTCMSIRKKCVHELIHALGFHHMHQRYDRDTALTINYENIIEDKIGSFRKFNNKWEAYNTPYDLLSCMHYATNGFSKNGNATILTKDPAYQDLIGKQFTLSDGDATRINRMYKCPDPYT